MPMIYDVTVFWVKLNPNKPERYQGKGPAKNGLQIRVTDRAKKEALEKEYGFKFLPKEDTETGKLYYQTSINAYTYASGPDKTEDVTRPNDPVEVITGNREPIDPDTIGNGSVVNIRFRTKEDKSSRTLTGVQVTKLIKYTPRQAEEFDVVEGFEVLGEDRGAGASDKDLF